MEQIFETSLLIGPSLCDAEGQLSYHDAFSVCMDIAAAHADALGCGLYDLSPKDLFWVTVKTQLRYFDRPRMMERVILRTWPEAPGKVRGNRSYEMRRNGALLIAGKTEWAVMHLKKMQPSPLCDVYPADIQFSEGSAAPGPFARISDDFSDCETLAEYQIRSTDIDVGGHMNNAAYLRAMFGCISNRELRDKRIGKIDAIFRSPCFEGETLTLQRRQYELGDDLRFAKEDGSTALLLRIERK